LKTKYVKTIENLEWELEHYEKTGKFGLLKKRIVKIKDMSKNFYNKLNE